MIMKTMKQYNFLFENISSKMTGNLMDDMIRIGKIRLKRPKFLISRTINTDRCFSPYRHPNASFAVYKKGTVPYYASPFDSTKLSRNTINVFPHPETVLPSDKVRSIMYPIDYHTGNLNHLIDDMERIYGLSKPDLMYEKGTKKYALYKRYYDRMLDKLIRTKFNFFKSELLSKPYSGEYAISKDQIPYVLKRINKGINSYGEIKKFEPTLLNGDYYSKGIISNPYNISYAKQQERRLRNLGIEPYIATTPQEFIDITKTIKGIQ